jgi:hypothetical protein
MNKIIVPLIFLLFLACEDVGRLDFDLEHATTVLKLESNILGETDEVYVNFMITFILTRPSGEGIIIERSIGDSTNYVPIDTVYGVSQFMSYTDNDSILQPSSTAYYKFGFLDDNTIDYFTSVDVDIPGSQHFYSPTADTVGDTLNIIFAQVPGFNDCSIAIYELDSVEPESLLALTTSKFDTTLTYPDTSIQIYMPDSIFPDTTTYAIKLSSSKSLVLITDTSIGFRAFFKVPQL